MQYRVAHGQDTLQSGVGQCYNLQHNYEARVCDITMALLCLLAINLRMDDRLSGT